MSILFEKLLNHSNF